MSIVIGIDPGSLHTGYGIIAVQASALTTLAHGVIDLSPKDSLAVRLAILTDKLGELLAQYKPTHLAIENIFLGKNADSAFKLGHVRGVVLAQAATRQMNICEFATRSVKKTIAGTGAATKEQVAFMIERILNTKSNLLDATDALALAICCARQLDVEQIFSSQKESQV